MGKVGIIGGVLALVGGALVLIESLLILLGMSLLGSALESYWALGAELYLLWPILSLILGAVALVGGVLALAGKKFGGVLAIIIAILWIIYPLLYELNIFVPDLLVLNPMGLLTVVLDHGIWVFTYEGLFVLVGGILGLWAGSGKE